MKKFIFVIIFGLLSSKVYALSKDEFNPLCNSTTGFSKIIQKESQKPETQTVFINPAPSMPYIPVLTTPNVQLPPRPAGEGWYYDNYKNVWWKNANNKIIVNQNCVDGSCKTNR